MRNVLFRVLTLPNFAAEVFSENACEVQGRRDGERVPGVRKDRKGGEGGEIAGVREKGEEWGG